MENDIYKMTPDQVADVLWNYLKRDPDHTDRRLTAWGSKTKLGLALSIQRLGERLHIPPENEA